MEEGGGEGMITRDQASVILGVSPRMVGTLKLTGKLMARQGWNSNHRVCDMFRRGDVEDLALSREHMHSVERQERACGWEARMKAVGRLSGEGELISVADAAKILGMSKVRVGTCIRSHRLLAFQSQPGKRGSPYLIPRSLVESYRDDPERKSRRKRSQAGKGCSWRPPGAEPVVEWVTCAEIAKWLGVATARVRAYRRMGKLEFRKRTEFDKYGHPNWHYVMRKRDVKAMLDDPQYQERWRRQVKGEMMREMKSITEAWLANGCDGIGFGMDAGIGWRPG